MAVSRNPYSDLNDEEIDAESPLTELVMSRVRDNVYSALTDPATAAPADFRLSLPLRAKTVDLVAGKALQTDGLGGFVLSVPSSNTINDNFNGTTAVDDTFITFTPALNIDQYNKFDIVNDYRFSYGQGGSVFLIAGVVNWNGVRVSGNNFDIAVQQLIHIQDATSGITVALISQLTRSFTTNVALATLNTTTEGARNVDADINITATTIEVKFDFSSTPSFPISSANFMLSS